MGAAGQADGVLLTKTAEVTGLVGALSTALAPWRKQRPRHGPAKVLLDPAVTTALDGDCLADAVILRGERGVYGPVASGATISRTIATLARDADRASAAVAVAAARRIARQRVWDRAGAAAPTY